MSFYFFAWLSLITWSISNLFEKFTSKYLIKNPWLFNFTYNIFSLFIILLLALYYGAGKVGDWQSIILASMFWALGNIFFFLVINLVDISVLSPAFSLKAVFALFLGFLLLGEKITGYQGVLILIIIISGLFVCYDEKLKLKSFFTKPMLFVLGEMITLALSNLFMNKTVALNGYWSSVLWIQILTTLFLIPTLPLFWKEFGIIKKPQILSLVFLSVLSTIGLLTSIKAYASNIGLSSVIMAIPMSMVLVIILSFFAPNLLEKHPTKVYAIRITAAVIMFLAAISL